MNLILILVFSSIVGGVGYKAGQKHERDKPHAVAKPLPRKK